MALVIQAVIFCVLLGLLIGLESDLTILPIGFLIPIGISLLLYWAEHRRLSRTLLFKSALLGAAVFVSWIVILFALLFKYGTMDGGI